MSAIQYSDDQDFTKPWVLRIGQVVLNFAGLEFETYLWLVQLSQNPSSIPEFQKDLFSKRVNRILTYLKTQSHTEDFKARSDTAWKEALALAILRNRVAHNPLTFLWADDLKKEGEPDYIGIPDMKKPSDSAAIADRLLSKSEMANTINQISALVHTLASLRKEWCSIRDNNREN